MWFLWIDVKPANGSLSRPTLCKQKNYFTPHWTNIFNLIKHGDVFYPRQRCCGHHGDVSSDQNNRKCQNTPTFLSSVYLGPVCHGDTSLISVDPETKYFFTKFLNIQKWMFSRRQEHKGELCECVCLTQAVRSPALWAAARLDVSLHTEVVTSLQLQLPATDLHHVAAAHSEYVTTKPQFYVQLHSCEPLIWRKPAVAWARAAKAMGAGAGGTSGPGSAGAVHLFPLCNITRATCSGLRKRRKLFIAHHQCYDLLPHLLCISQHYFSHLFHYFPVFLLVSEEVCFTI